MFTEGLCIKSALWQDAEARMGAYEGRIISNGGQGIMGIILFLLRWRTQKQGASCPRSPRELMPEHGLDSGLLILSKV